MYRISRAFALFSDFRDLCYGSIAPNRTIAAHSTEMRTCYFRETSFLCVDEWMNDLKEKVEELARWLSLSYSRVQKGGSSAGSIDVVEGVFLGKFLIE